MENKIVNKTGKYFIGNIFVRTLLHPTKIKRLGSNIRNQLKIFNRDFEPSDSGVKLTTRLSLNTCKVFVKREDEDLM
jgi:hypothetical protein